MTICWYSTRHNVWYNLITGTCFIYNKTKYLTRERTPLASMANISIILYLPLFSWSSWLYGIFFSLTIHSQQFTWSLIALNCSLIVDCCRFPFLRRSSRYIHFRLHICKLGNDLTANEVCHWLLMRKRLLSLLMLVILMLILMLLTLNTGYADADTVLCIRIMSLCWKLHLSTSRTTRVYFVFISIQGSLHFSYNYQISKENL